MDRCSTFHFHCRACGRCCRYIQGVPLTSHDVFKLARRGNQSPVQAIASAFELVDAHVMPLPTLKTNRDGYCVLLKDHLCSVYEDKPFVCRLFPVQQEWRDGRFHYSFIPDCYEPCGTGQAHVLGSWLDEIGEVEQGNAALHSELYCELGSMLVDVYLPRDQMDALSIFLFDTIYLSYDTAIDYGPQFRSNAEKAMGYVRRVLGKQNEISGGAQ